MPVTNPIHKMALKVGTEVLVHAGPGLARVTPMRHAALRVGERYLRRARATEYARGSYPPGVIDDHTAMGLAIVHMVERLFTRPLAPAARRAMIDNLLRGALLEQGYRDPVDRFAADHDTDPPGFLLISPGKTCNLRCAGCYADAGPTAEKLDWDTFDRIVSEAKTLWGARFFAISGGEPLAYRSDGQGVLDVAARHPDCFFLMYTNGTLISDQVAARLAEIGNLTPAISVEGFEAHTDERRGPGVYAQVLAAMARLRAAGVPFGLSLTATRQNAEEILSDEFIDFFFEQQDALYGWIFHYMPIGRAFTLDLMPTPQQRLWMWRRSWEIVRQRRLFLADFWNHGTLTDGCISAGRANGGGYLYIDWNGSVTPCVFMPYSPVNIKTVYARGGTLNDVWADPFFAGIRNWQETYWQKNGNLLMPCPIRDHHTDLRRLLAEHEPDPTDENARAALLDPNYARGLAEYDRAYQALSEPIWEQHYLRPD